MPAIGEDRLTREESILANRFVLKDTPSFSLFFQGVLGLALSIEKFPDNPVAGTRGSKKPAEIIIIKLCRGFNVIEASVNCSNIFVPVLTRSL
jgi:hypothetical protein